MISTFELMVPPSHPVASAASGAPAAPPVYGARTDEAGWEVESLYWMNVSARDRKGMGGCRVGLHEEQDDPG